MKTLMTIILGLLVVCGSYSMMAQDSGINLQTRWTGQPPTHETPSSAAQWMQNPLATEVEVAVTNLCAATNQYLEVDIAGQKLSFYGAGVDEFGSYIPTNYPMTGVSVFLRRSYHMNMTCPNSGPDGCQLFKWSDLNSADYDINIISNDIATASAPVALSAYLWTNFYAADLAVFTNGDPSYDLERQTNLVVELNRIISSGSLYTPARFTNVVLQPDTTNLLAQSPQGQNLVELNRMLLRDAYDYAFPNPSDSDNSGTAQVTFFVQPPPELQVSKIAPAPQYYVAASTPDGSDVQDNSDGSAEVGLLNPGTGFVSTNSALIQVEKLKFAHFGIGDGCDDARPAPGVGKWMKIGPGCTADTNRISVNWAVSVGRTFDGLAAGQIALNVLGLTPGAYTPYMLFYNASSTNILGQAVIVTTNTAVGTVTNIEQGEWTNDVVVDGVTNAQTEYGLVTNITPVSDLALRQLLVCQTFVDITAPTTNQTTLNFYLPSQVATNRDQYGVFTHITNSPFVTWIIQNPHPGTATNLLVIESRNGLTSTQSLARASTSAGVTWTLTQGTGTATRVETRQVSFVGSPVTNRVEVDTVAYAGSSAPAYQCQETYNFYPWGSELVQTSIPNNPNYVTTYAFDNNPADGGYGQPSVIMYPDGYWERRNYYVTSPDGEFYWYELMHPYLTDPSSATTPDEATDANCSVDYVDDLYFAQSAGQRRIDTYDHGTLFKGGTTGNQDLNGLQTSWSEYFPGAMPQSGDGLGETPFSGFSNALKYEPDYASEQPPGLAGHPDDIVSSAKYQGFVYNQGVFDSVSNVFDINPTNYVYTWASVTNGYPDFAESELDRDVDYPWGNNGGEEDVYGSQTYGWSSFAFNSFICTTMDGCNLDGIVELTFITGETRRQRNIYHAGNLIQHEDTVFTSVGDGAEPGESTADPLFTVLTKTRYYVDSLGRATNVALIDPVSSSVRTLYTADYRGTTGIDGELLLSETDAEGGVLTYTYDALQRVQSVTVAGFGGQFAETTNFIYDANGNVTSQTTVAGTLSQSVSNAYDLVGRVTNHVDQSGIAVSTAFSANNQITTTTFPGGVTQIKQQSVDRRPLSVTGSGCVPQYYTHAMYAPVVAAGLQLFGPLRMETTYSGSPGSARWRTLGTDVPGNQAWEEWPTGTESTNTISVSSFYLGNQLMNQQTNFGASGNTVSTYLDYDQESHPNFNCTWESSAPSYLTSGRLQAVVNMVTQIGGNWFAVTTNFIYLDDQNATNTVQSIHLEQLNGFTGTETAYSIDYDADTNETKTTTYLNRANNLVTVVTSTPNTSSLPATNVYQNGCLISSSTLSIAAPTVYGYDGLRRTNSIQSPLRFSASTTFDPATAWVTSQTDFTGQSTSYQYYNTNEANAGKLKCQISATGKKTYYSYTSQGQLAQTWGDVPYPAQYSYDQYGALTNLVTFRGGSGWNASSWPGSPGTGDNTYWIYDPASGALVQKIDAKGAAVTYTYDLNTGRLWTRSWARPVGGVNVMVTNSYDIYGDLTEQDYNDGTASVIYNNFNRSAQPREIIDSAGTNELTYDYANRLVTTTYTNGLLNGITVSNHFNAAYGRTAVAVQGLSSPLEDDYGYDTYGRMGSVSNNGCSAVYGYVPNSDLLQSTTFKNGSATVMTTSRTWDYGARLHSIANVVNNTPVTSHSYQYDSLNRRTQATLEDGSYWQYGYDNRDELASASRHWSTWQNNAPVSGQQFTYGYDNIGNRITNCFGGDTNGQNLRTITYGNNSLNESTNILTPGFENIAGAAFVTNPVTVNGTNADRAGEYFHREVAVANSGGPVWQNVTNIAGAFTNKGGVLVPASSRALTYDVDGNLSSDGVWAYQWDGENRLVSMEMATNIFGLAASNCFRLDFAYDYMGRRVQKIISTWGGTNFIPQSANIFVYDGWNLLAVVEAQTMLLQSFMWGNDLSGTVTNAGGVGGLLMAAISGTNCFASYDGNGNVTALINSADKSLAARYEYGPCGEMLRANGMLSRQFPFRFSTKFFDYESGLIYYGCRYYSPNIGKWISRDPAQEKGGINLYCFVKNNSVLHQDRNGQDMCQDAADIIEGALKEMDEWQVGSKEWLDIYAQTQRSLYPALLRGAAVYSGPFSIVRGIIGGATTVGEAYEVAPLATAVGVTGSVVAAAGAGAFLGAALYEGGEALGAYLQYTKFTGDAMVDYWSSPD